MQVSTDFLATKGQRFIHYIIDTAIQYGIGYLIGVVIGWMYLYFNIEAPYNWLMGLSGWEDWLFSTSIAFFYYLLFEIFTQRTMAKYITGTMILTNDGEKPTAGAIFKRSLCRLIPLDAFSYISADRPIGWHDSIPEVIVVNVKKYEEAVRLKNSFDEIGREEADNDTLK